jgi:hypothetical protein
LKTTATASLRSGSANATDDWLPPWPNVWGELY